MNTDFDNNTNTSFAELSEIIRRGETFAICGHVNPDGDSVGSVLAVLSILDMLGKKSTPLLANASRAPKKYAFLAGYERFLHATRFSSSVDTFISVDTPNVDRMGDAIDVKKKAKICISIDHHPEIGVEADKTIRDIKAASTTMLVWELAKEVLGSPTKEIATACLVGLMTDTGSFQFQNMDTRAFQSAAEMCSFGANPSEIATLVFQSKSLGLLQMQGRLISRLELSTDNNVCWGWIDENDYSELGVLKEETEGLIDTVRSVELADISILAQGRKNDVRCSIRSKTDFDVSEVARHFGGGGHKAASGFTLSGKLEANIDKIRDLVDKIDDQYRAYKMQNNIVEESE